MSFSISKHILISHPFLIQLFLFSAGLQLFLSFSECPKLDDVISRRCLAAIAKSHITHWEPLGPFLGLTRQQEVEIAQNYSSNYGLQKRECLEVWKEVKGDRATYRALISAAEEAEDQQLADAIRNMIQK